MKYLSFAAIIAGTALAQSISGIAVLKGSLKTKTMVRGIPSTCRVKVTKVRNIMEEDAFGFPGYRVSIEVNVQAKDFQNDLTVKEDREFEVTNFWSENGRVVAKDFDYFSTDGAKLSIKQDGRLEEFSYNGKNGRITCSF